MTGGWGGAVCPQCGSAGAVHSIAELAALARAQLGEAPTGYPGAAPPGYAAQPPAGPVPGPVPGPRPSRSADPVDSGGDALAALEGDIAVAAAGSAVRFLGRAIGKRMQRTYEERVRPALAARHEALLHEQIAIAERHPDLRACLTDQVIFLAGGTRAVPMASMGGMLTLEQSDALVAGLRGS